MEGIFLDWTFLWIAIGTMLLGVMSGLMGSIAVLRSESLLGDTISHASLPGIVLAFMLTGIKSSMVLLIGALVIGFLSAFIVRYLSNHSKLKKDTGLAIVLSVFFGLGLVLLTFVQRQQNADQAGLERYIFGQAVGLLKEDVYIMLGGLFFIGIILFLGWTKIKLILFDPIFAQTLGISIRRWNFILTLCLVLIIVLGIQTVGVVLMSSLLLAPAAAARQWTDSLSKMLLIAGVFGAISGIGGAISSVSYSHLPTGPVIVLFVSILVFVSLLFAPKRGLIYKAYQQRKKRKNLKHELQSN